MNLIICYTPLQMMIARSIILNNTDKKFFLLLLSRNTNEKYEFYFNELSKYVENKLHYKHILPAKFGISFLEMITIYNLKVCKKLEKFKFDNVYLASIEGVFFQLILSKVKYNNLYTFDDGIANISKDSHYYIQKKIQIRKIFGKLLNIDFNIYSIKKKIKKHYTLFPNVENICSNLETIKLKGLKHDDVIEDLNLPFDNSKNEINIFLGQPLNEINPNFKNKQLGYLLSEFNIDFYFPHPRENFDVDTKLIKSKLIIEDYILSISNRNPNYKFNIYSVCSTAVLNIKNYDNIECYYVIPDSMENRLRNFVNLIKNNFDIRILNIKI